MYLSVLPSELALEQLDGGGPGDGRLPALLLHGSPGSARNFTDLARRLDREGRSSFALDLPGFGRSSTDVPSYSILAHAHAALAALDELGLERVHVITWSMGGGVGLHLTELAPERVASLTQIASIGVQAAEGSGSYWFEHLKYALLGAGLEAAVELVPHFGLLTPLERGRSFVRNFWDTDQRPLRGIMERARTPTLILQGRDDPLVPAWGAEVSHALIETSRLVLFDGSHFLLFEGGQLDGVMEQLSPFLARHDRAGSEVERARIDLAGPRTGAERWVLEPFALMRLVPYWLLALVVAGLTRLAPRSGPVATGCAVAGLQLDLGLAAVTVLLGGWLRPGARSTRRTGNAPARAGAGKFFRAALRRALRGVGAGLWMLAGLALAGAAAAALGRAAPQLLAVLVLGAGLVRRRSTGQAVSVREQEP